MLLEMNLLSLVLLANAVLAWNPSNSYTPSHVQCPKNDFQLVRSSSQGLNPDESSWVSARHANTNPAMIDFLKRVNLTDFDAEKFLSNSSVTLGLAFSGGGYRAMFSGAGQFAALDNRTAGSTRPGHLGGLVQASTYFSGLSGGSWLVGSIVTNNFSSIDGLLNSDKVWDISKSPLNFNNPNMTALMEYFGSLSEGVKYKGASGFDVTITDVWGRLLSQYLIGLPDGGPAMTWSDIREYDAFKSHQMPFPLVLANGRAPDTKIISINSTVFEFTPYELGSWDRSLESFTDIKWLGSNVTDGKVNSDSCVLGFDNSGFVMGTSSSLFNTLLPNLARANLPPDLLAMAQEYLTKLDEENKDIAIYAPNPFMRTSGFHSNIESSEFLSLVDGGEDGQNVPLHPLVQPERNVDVIIAFDNSADTPYSWPDSSALSTAYARQFSNQTRNIFFPAVPDKNTYINNELYKRPLFLGCYASNFTELRAKTHSPANYTPPLIIWNSNGYYTANSNSSTLQMQYPDSQVLAMIQNTYAVATYGNGTMDAEYGACVGCALVQREVERRNGVPTEQCQKCFAKYCWDGKMNSTTPSAAQIMGMWASPNKKSSDSSGSGTVSGSGTGTGSSTGSGGSTTTSSRVPQANSAAIPILQSMSVYVTSVALMAVFFL